MLEALAGRPILVIEDDEAIMEAIEYVLEEEGYGVLTARNGREALSLLKDRGPLPCLILLDMFMPVMDGWGFLNQIKTDQFRSFADIPIIMTSAAGDRVKDVLSQVRDYLKKPISIDVLLTTVEKYCTSRCCTPSCPEGC